MFSSNQSGLPVQRFHELIEGGRVVERPEHERSGALIAINRIASRCVAVSLAIAMTSVGCGPTTALPLAKREIALKQMESVQADRNIEALVQRIDLALERELTQRRMDASVNAAWQIMHGVVCYGKQLKIQTEDRGEVGAIEYAFHEGLINGFELSTTTTLLPSIGRVGILAKLEPGSFVGQGHPDQWLAIFAMANLPLDTEVQIDGKKHSLLQWARQTQLDVTNNILDEYSWTLIALTHYFPDEPQWPTADGELMNWEVLVEAELTYELNSSACGGTHRLAGLVRAVEAKERLGLPDTEVWTEAKRLISAQVANVKQNRSPNGALSSYYFVRPSQTNDLAAELSSSGHLFEFIALALPTEQLDEPWVTLSATRLCDVLELAQDAELDCGALYHGLNGLKIYRDRIASAGN